MDGDRLGPHVPPVALEALRNRATGAGLSVDSMASDLGVQLHGQNGQTVLPLEGFLRLHSRVSALLDGDRPGMSKRHLLAESIELGLSRLPAHGTFRQVVATFSSSYNLIHGRPFSRVEATGEVLRLIIDDGVSPGSSENGEQAFFGMETRLLFAHALFRLIVPSAAVGGWRGVELLREGPPARVPFERLVRTSFDRQHYALVYDAEAADRVVNLPRPGTISFAAVTEEQIQLLRSGVNEETFSARVRMLIEEGAEDQTVVARALGMSVATLRRRLTDEGVSFRGIRIEALCGLADHMLRSELPLAQVAERLGFADVRSFSRAYKGWTGITPNAKRRASSL